jgi:integrase/recombinase XerD
MTPLRRRMIEDMRIHSLSAQTQRVYVEQVSRSARHFGQPPQRLSGNEIRAWRIHLLKERRLGSYPRAWCSSAGLRVRFPELIRRPRRAA